MNDKLRQEEKEQLSKMDVPSLLGLLQNYSYRLGLLSAAEDNVKYLYQESGRMYALKDDDKAKFFRSLAEKKETDAIEGRKEYDMNIKMKDSWIYEEIEKRIANSQTTV